MKQQTKNRIGRGYSSYRRVVPVLSALFLLILPSTALSSESSAAAPVAQVFQKLISVADLDPSPETMTRQKVHLGQELTELWQQEERRTILRNKIVEAVVSAFAEEQQVEARDEEIAAYLDYLRWLLQTRLTILTRESAALTAELEQAKPGGKDEKWLQLRLERLNSLIAWFSQETTDTKSAELNPARTAMPQTSEARAGVKRWKLDKALYDRFGGEVVCNGSRLVPVGALRALLEERLNSLDVVILDPVYLDLFDDYRPPLQPGAFPVTHRQAATYYADPWWVRAKELDLFPELPPRPAPTADE
ncbi:hypothetical protein JCM30471_30650 [Desulfuromonas carbonis]|uniref:hypothetical protein n=1 Tax=Desulfuromonas sp. DDH964 TaxID=1823759 RepID=UPI00078C2A64|nr:hypothetical protein [Desulfuromonas sp. DDH964]AMV71225.1 hypothetical protein DBW_0842 [Desulfuromonas sp. DDH964]